MGDLSKVLWRILDSLADGSEPLEVVDGIVREVDTESAPQETLEHLFELHRRGMVTIEQAPLTALGQRFSKKEIVPDSPEEIIGDLKDHFMEYCRKREYLWYFALEEDDNPCGVPFGIYVEMTPAGRKEWDKPDYRGYWPKEKV